VTIRVHEAGLISNIDALADANDQFHWGASIEAIQTALRNLRARNLNPILAELLEAKIARLEHNDLSTGSAFPIQDPESALDGPSPS
jgi:hypothetical protein